jgi:ATP-dependent helicase/nuclease subunit A
MNFTPQQHAAISLDGNLVVTAGAGSGKTRVLVERYLRLLANIPLSHTTPEATSPPFAGDIASLLAITFTDKAAREMRDRVRATVEKQARTAPLSERMVWEERRASVESARIGTIHSFCAMLLRDHPAETNLDPCFTTLDEVESLLLLTECVDDILSASLQEQFTLFTEFSPEELHTMLLEMVRGGSGVRDALAALPSSGDALQAMWRSRLVQVQAMVVEDMVNTPAWRHAATALASLAVNAPTQDRIGEQVSNLANWLSTTQFTSEGETWQMPDFTPLQSLDLRGGSKKNWGSAEDLAQAKDALRMVRDTYRAYATLLTLVPDEELEARAARSVLELATLYTRASEHYAMRKRQQDALDFDDLIHTTRHLLENHPAVRSRWQAELRSVLVDEFQDTDEDQRAIIYALTEMGTSAAFAAESLPVAAHVADNDHPAPSLFVVGDGKQSIYRFRGADVSVFRSVQQDIVANGGEAVSLSTSFRTHPALLEWINKTTAAIFARTRPLQPYETVFEPLQPFRPAAPHQRCVELHIIVGGQERTEEVGAEGQADGAQEQETPDRREREAQVIAGRIKALVSGAEGELVYDVHEQRWRVPKYGDFALLFRASTAFEHYEHAFRETGIPYLTTAGRGYYGRKEVQDLINLLYVLNDPMDELSLVGVLRSSLFALDDATIIRLRFANPRSLWDALMMSEQLELAACPADTTDEERSSVAVPSPLAFARETLRELSAIRGKMTVVELLRAALEKTGYLATISGLYDGDRRRVNVEKLIEAARKSAQAGLSDFSLYLERLLQMEPREGEAPLEAEGVVRLMTVHRSKGLEFPVVVLPDLARRPPPPREKWIARSASGVAVRLRSQTGEWQKPLAYHLAEYEEQRMEQAERERLLYVALTRAQDYLLLSGPAAQKSTNDWFSSIMTALGSPWEEGGPVPGSSGVLQVWWHAEQ